ncbi:MFS transporter [Aquicoccus porphyridii]|uniref:MFS transporter n=1 Tax=Aquicoccus porphyridii TaxID=1852029 RepID=UPI00165DF51F|nr:MFS transporter [Aquicoccus porphyridii]
MNTTTHKFSIAPLLAVTFVGTLGFSIVTPFLVVLVTQWGGNAVVYGILAATYSFFQLFGAPILGKMSDRIGRRRVLLLSQFGTLLSWAIFLVAFALPDAALRHVTSGWLGDFVLTLPLLVLFVARAADGLTGGNVSVSNAYLADITTDEDRTKNFGQMAVASNLGFVIGPALAGLLGATILGEVLPVIAALAISAIALGLIQFGLVDVAPKPIAATLEEPSACDLYGQETQSAYQLDCAKPNGMGAVLALTHMPALMAVNFLVMLGFSFFYVAFPVHAVEGLEWDVIQIGIFFAVLSLVMILVEGPVLARVGKISGDRALMSFGALCLASGFVALLVPETVAVYFGAALIALGNGLMWPTFMAVLSKAAGDRLQGAVQGYAQSAGAVASIAGLIAGGIGYVALGPGLFVFAAGAIAVSALLVLTYRPQPVRAPLGD